MYVCLYVCMWERNTSQDMSVKLLTVSCKAYNLQLTKQCGHWNLVLKLSVFCAVRQVTVYIPTNALYLDKIESDYNALLKYMYTLIFGHFIAFPLLTLHSRVVQRRWVTSKQSLQYSYPLCTNIILLSITKSSVLGWETDRLLNNS